MRLSNNELHQIAALVEAVENTDDIADLVWIASVRLEDQDGGVLGYIVNRDGDFYFYDEDADAVTLAKG